MRARPTLLLVDDHPLVCSGLMAMLEPRYEVVGMVHDGDEVLGMVASLHPDAVLMDLSLPGTGGLALARALKAGRRPPRVLIVTMHAELVYVDEALRSGADGYLLKNARAVELRKAVAEVLAGRTYIAPDLRPAPPSEVPSVAVTEPPAWVGELEIVSRCSRRQQEVLLLVGRGLGSQEVAERLHLSVKAIEYHRARIRQVLGITSEAAFYRCAALYAEKVARASGASPGGETRPGR